MTLSTRHINSATAPLTVDGVLNSLLSVQSPEKRTMSDEPPTLKQIVRSRHHLEAAMQVAIIFEGCAKYLPEASVGVSRRLFHSYMQQAANALGFDLIERQPPHIVVNNDASIYNSGR